MLQNLICICLHSYKGDIIDIICNSPMGMWTGMLNIKVGIFKFIYVDVISEEEAAPKKIKVPRSSRRENPQNLQEFLKRIHLQVSKPLVCLVLLQRG